MTRGPYVVDGTVAGSFLLADARPAGSSSDPDSWSALAGGVFFAAACGCCDGYRREKPRERRRDQVEQRAGDSSARPDHRGGT